LCGGGPPRQAQKQGCHENQAIPTPIPKILITQNGKIEASKSRCVKVQLSWGFLALRQGESRAELCRDGRSRHGVWIVVPRSARDNHGTSTQRVILFAAVRTRVLVVRPVAPEPWQPFALELDDAAAGSAPNSEDDVWGRGHALASLRRVDHCHLFCIEHVAGEITRLCVSAQTAQFAMSRMNVDRASTRRAA